VGADLIDSLLRPRQPSIPDLVSVLRDIHERKSIPASQPVERTRGSNPTDLPLVDPRLILDRLARGAGDLTRWLGPTPGGEFAGNPDASVYGALQERVGQLETELRCHVETVDRLLESKRPASEHAAHTFHQQTLYLQCPSGGRTAGRFRCVNRRGDRSSVTSMLRPFTISLELLAAAPTLSVRPGSFILNAEASEIITVEIDFSPCPELASGVVQTSIDLRMNDSMALKIWIEVELHEQC